MCYLINKSPIFFLKKKFTSGLKLYMGSPQKKKKKKNCIWANPNRLEVP